MPDLLASDAILVELKATKDSPDALAAHRLNSLKAAGLLLCLLLDFRKPRVEIKRDRRQSVCICGQLPMNQQIRNKLHNVVAQCRKLLEEPRMNADEHRLTGEAMNARADELWRTGIDVTQQEPIEVYYHGLIVGDYFARHAGERRDHCGTQGNARQPQRLCP